MLHFLPIDDKTWFSLINEDAGAMIFHHPAWIQNLSDVYGYTTTIAAVKDEHGRVCAGLPAAEVNSPLTGKRLISLPFSDFCAPLSRSQSALEALADGMQDYQAQRGIPWEVRWELPQRPGAEAVQDYVMHSAALDADPEVVFNRINRKVRKYIRSAANRGVTLEHGTSQEELARFYRLQLITRRKHGLPAQPWKYFSLLGRNLLEKGLGEIYLAFADGECLAGLLLLHWGETLTLKYGASDENRLRELRPNHLLDWTAIRWGCENGYRTLDVGRSDLDQDGLRDYKNRWGYEEKPLFYTWLGGAPAKKATRGEAARLFTGLMRAAPLWACRAAGELLYRHFP